MLRWTKMSPGRAPVRTDSGTRASAHPIQRHCRIIGREREGGCVGATHLGVLSLCRPLEEAGVGLVDGVGPCLVGVEEGLDGGGHGGQTAEEGEARQSGNEAMKNGRVGFLFGGRDLMPCIK